MRSLIADDEKTGRILLENILKDFSECQHATNGSEALAMALAAIEVNRPFELICLDIDMPELGGKEVLAAIRAKEEEMGLVGSKAATVIITTGHCDISNMYESNSAGCTSFFCKPIDRQKLISELTRLGIVRKA